jgi:hypothetical protein
MHAATIRRDTLSNERHNAMTPEKAQWKMIMMAVANKHLHIFLEETTNTLVYFLLQYLLKLSLLLVVVL